MGEVVEPTDSPPSTSNALSNASEESENKSKNRVYERNDDWNFFKRARQHTTDTNIDETNQKISQTIPLWLRNQYTEETWLKLSVIERWRLQQESKTRGSLSTSDANELQISNEVQRSKIADEKTKMNSIPALFIEDKKNNLTRKVHLNEDGVDDVVDDALRPAPTLPDWVIPKDLLLRSFFQFRTAVDSQTEDRLIRDSFMIFDDDPICGKPVENKDSESEAFELQPLEITEVELDHRKKTKSIPIVRRVSPTSDLIKDLRKVTSNAGYALFWEHQISRRELASIRQADISDNRPIFFWSRDSGQPPLDGRKYRMLNTSTDRTTKLARMAISDLRRHGGDVTVQSIGERMEEIDKEFEKMKAFMRNEIKLEESTLRAVAQLKGETAEIAKPVEAISIPSLTLTIPEQTPKNSGGPSPDSPNKRVLPARTRRPTVKEAERREEKERQQRRLRDKCSKEREEVAASAARSMSKSPEKEPQIVITPATLTPQTPSPMKSSPAVRHTPRHASPLRSNPKRRKGHIRPGRCDEEEEREPRKIGITNDGKAIFLEKGIEGSLSIHIEDGEEMKNVKKHEFNDEEEYNSDDGPDAASIRIKSDAESSTDDEERPSLNELTNLDSSEVLVYRNARNEVKLAPRCCLADSRNGVWTPCPRPGRYDKMSTTLAKQAAEMELNIAWRYEAPNQRICQLHSRLLRSAGFGGNVLEETIRWMGRKSRTEIEKQQIVGVPITPSEAQLKEENKWINKTRKQLSSQYFIEDFKKIKSDAAERKKRMRRELSKKMEKMNDDEIAFFKEQKRKERYFMKMAQKEVVKLAKGGITQAEIDAMSKTRRNSLRRMLDYGWRSLRQEEKEDEEEENKEEDDEFDLPMTPASLADNTEDYSRSVDQFLDHMVRPSKQLAPKKKRLSEVQLLDEEGEVVAEEVVDESIDIEKYCSMYQAIVPMIKSFKGSANRQLRAFEALLGPPQPALQEALQDSVARPYGGYAMLRKTERVVITVATLPKAGKKKLRKRKNKRKVIKKYVVVGMVADDVAKEAPSVGFDKPVLFLAYRKNDKRKNIVKIMPSNMEGTKSSTKKWTTGTTTVEDASRRNSPAEIAHDDDTDTDVMLDKVVKVRKEKMELNGEVDIISDEEFEEIDEELIEGIEIVQMEMTDHDEDMIVVEGVTDVGKEEEGMIPEEARIGDDESRQDQAEEEEVAAPDGDASSQSGYEGLDVADDGEGEELPDAMRKEGEVSDEAMEDQKETEETDEREEMMEVMEERKEDVGVEDQRKEEGDEMEERREGEDDEKEEDEFERENEEVELPIMELGGEIEIVEEVVTSAVPVRKRKKKVAKNDDDEDIVEQLYDEAEEEEDERREDEEEEEESEEDESSEERTDGDISLSPEVIKLEEDGIELIDFSQDEEEVVEVNENEGISEVHAAYLRKRRGVIVVDDKRNLTKLRKLKKICLPRLKQQPDADEIFEKMIKDRLRKFCTKPEHRHRQEPADEVVDIDGAIYDIGRDDDSDKLDRIMWNAKIDRSMRVYGIAPSTVPVKYIEERASELNERIEANIEVEDSLLWEQQQQRLDDEAAIAARSPISSASSSTSKTLPGVGVKHAKMASTYSRGLVRLQSAYDRLKNERMYWNRREDGQWKRKRSFYSRTRSPPPLDDEEISRKNLKKPMTIGRLTSVPKGSLLRELTKSDRAKLRKKKKSMKKRPKKTIPLGKALQRIDIDSLSVAQMKKMISAMEKRFGKVRYEEVESSADVEEDKQQNEKIESVKKSKKMRSKHCYSLLEWSMADLTREDVVLDLKKNGIELDAASKEQIGASITGLQKLKSSVYSQVCSSTPSSSELQDKIIIDQKIFTPWAEKNVKQLKRKRTIPQPASRLEGVSKSIIKEKKKRKNKRDKKMDEVQEMEEGNEAEEEKSFHVQLRVKGKKAKKVAMPKINKKKNPIVHEVDNSSDSDDNRSEQSIEDAKRYKRQREAAEAYREARRNSESEHSRDSQLSAESLARFIEDSSSVVGGYRYDEPEEVEMVDGVLVKKRRRAVDPTGFSLLPSRSIQRYRERFGLEPGVETDSRAVLAVGAQMHFERLEGSAAAIPYFAHALKTGTNMLDLRDARHMRRMLQKQAEEKAQLEAMGQLPEMGRGARYRVPANTRRPLIMPEIEQPEDEPEEAEEEPNDDDE